MDTDTNPLLCTGPVEVFGELTVISAGTRLKFHQSTPPKGWRFIEKAEGGIICEKE